MLMAVAFVTLLLFIRWVPIIVPGQIQILTYQYFSRAIYRTIELADGWTGRIIATELYFSALTPNSMIIS
jgi:hypothetical protein